MKNLEGRVVLVTGASGGLGEACALAFADEGCDLVLAARRKEELEKVAEKIRVRGRKSLVVPTDVAVESQVRTLADKSFTAFGQVDIVVCNAGIGWTGPTHRMDHVDWDKVLGVNLYGVIDVIRFFSPPMVERRDGHIVIMSSAFGLTGIPFGTLYSASKSALIGLGECLRSEMRRYHIGVTTVCPGLIESDLIKNTHFKHADERARALSNMVKPMPANKFARIVVASVRRDRGLVVVTPLAKLLWYSKRLSQRLFEMISLFVAMKTQKHIQD